MRKLWMLSAMLVAAVAFAQEPAHPGTGPEERPVPESVEANQPSEAPGGAAAHEETDVAGYIFHHVADSTEYEFEIPLGTGHNPVIHFPMWRFDLKPGACPTDPHASVGFGELLNGCLDLTLTKHTVFLFLTAVLLIVALLVGANRNKNQLVPRGASQNLFEMLVVFVRDELAIKNIGPEEGPRYTPFLLSAFFFILFCNLIGLFPWSATPTGNLAVTCALALFTFVITQIAGIRAAGLGGYLKHLTGGVHWLLWPIMVPVEILGLFTKPFALTVRLFANMLAGHIVIFFLLGLIFIMESAVVSVIAVPFAFGIYLLELFVAFVQAYVFAMLSALFIGMSVAMGHHGHDEHGHEHGAEGHTHDHGKAHTLGS